MRIGFPFKKPTLKVTRNEKQAVFRFLFCPLWRSIGSLIFPPPGQSLAKVVTQQEFTASPARVHGKVSEGRRGEAHWREVWGYDSWQSGSAAVAAFVAKAAAPRPFFPHRAAAPSRSPPAPRRVPQPPQRQRAGLLASRHGGSRRVRAASGDRGTPCLSLVVPRGSGAAGTARGSRTPPSVAWRGPARSLRASPGRTPCGWLLSWQRFATYCHLIESLLAR